MTDRHFQVSQLICCATIHVAGGAGQWAIPLFNYTPLQMTINGVPAGGYREYVTEGGHLNPCPGGLEGIIDACPGGSGTTWKIVQGGGAKQKLVQGALTSLSLGGRGIIQACPGVFL